jgi:hypothetical protein
MTRTREPFRYKPQFGGAPDPTRCAAGISHGRITFTQCAKPRLPDSEWCKQHKPIVVAANAPLLYVVEETSGGHLKVATARIAKETPKQIKLEYGSGPGFGYRTAIDKDETTGVLEFGARTELAAIERYLTEREAVLLRAEEAVVSAKDSVAEAKLLLDETKKGTPPTS